LARSENAGRTFADAIEIDAAGSFGNVDIAVLESGDAIVSWLRSEAEGLALAIRRVSPDGTVHDLQTVAFIDTGRPADFPQMVYDGQRLVFAWTDFEGAGTVKTAIAEVSR
jgi:hypothetical protein